jgi:hypothetical protein
VAVGNNAGSGGQGSDAVSIGHLSGISNQGSFAVAIGSNAGGTNQGINSIAIGNLACQNSSVANSICLNASGVVLNPGQAGFFVNPIRQVPLGGVPTNVLYFNPATNEILRG